MRNGNGLTLFSLVLAALFLFSCAGSQQGRHGSADGAGERTDVLYSCACGSDCKCGSVSTESGDCKCGKPMEWGHVVRIEGDTAFVCACGNQLKRVNLKDSGIFYCNCGGKCSCNVLSDQPGQCRCGMQLHQ